MPYWIWLIVIGAFLIVEALTTSLTTIWFALGSLAALIVSLINEDLLWLQVTLFVVVSILSLLAMRPLIKKFRKSNNTATNVDRLIGTTAIVAEEINNLLEKGSINISGISWTARSIDDTAIPKGATVRVEQIDGVKLIVSVL